MKHAGIEATITAAGHTHSVGVATSDRELVAQAIMRAVLEALPATLTDEVRFAGSCHVRKPTADDGRRAIAHVELSAVQRHSCMVKAEDTL